MDKKIYFIGDSFVAGFLSGDPYMPLVKKYWLEKNYKAVVESDSSRDVQTIIDYWIKYIPFITPDDLVVVILPFFGRTRLPRDSSQYAFSNLENNFNNYFVGTNSYEENIHILEYWGTRYSYEYFKENLNVQSIINQSKAASFNYIEVIDSLNKITPCKTFVHCWDNLDYISDCIVFKNELINKLGMWETKNDIYIKTNGSEGIKGDIHWSDDMNLKFMDYVYEYFKNN